MLLELAEQSEGARPATLEVADRQGIPRSLAPRIAQRLVKAGLIESWPGRSGGLSLAQPTESINLRQVVEIFHGPIAVNLCVQGEGACPRDVICPAHEVWVRVQVTVVNQLESATLTDLVERARQMRADRGDQPEIDNHDL
jgi:Rrf2 family protein